MITEKAAALSNLGHRAQAPVIAQLMTATIENPRLLSLAAGFTDNATLPIDHIRQITAKLAESQRPEWLQYGLNQGRSSLRQIVANRIEKLDAISLGNSPESRVLISNGSQQTLYLAVQTLCDVGDIILVDRPSYFVFLEMLRGLGVQARTIPVDADGNLEPAAFELQLDAMRRNGELQRLKAIYFVSYFSNPSGRTLRDLDKRRIATLLAGWGIFPAVIEDAAYRELWFEKPPEAKSVLALEEWAEFPKLYTSTFTKSFASGLKVGFGYCTDEIWLSRMLHVKGHQDFGTANAAQTIVETALADRVFDEHLVLLRKNYAKKMRALHEALTAEGLSENGWRWSIPEGGLYLWLESSSEKNLGMRHDFFKSCLGAGVLYVPGELCFGDLPQTNTMRLSYGVLKEADLKEAAQRLCSVALKKTASA